MINMAAMAADALGRLLGDEFRNTFGSGHPDARRGWPRLAGSPWSVWRAATPCITPLSTRFSSRWSGSMRSERDLPRKMILGEVAGVDFEVSHKAQGFA
jgi:hypothetical protein